MSDIKVEILLAAALLAGSACARKSTAPEGNAKLRELDEILASRNDNDPRLDRDFLGLDEADKSAFRRRYDSLAPEKRNERGTIVFLLGRNLQSEEDWSFFRKVVDEPPCQSLADCSKPAAGASGPGDDVTLAYPAMVALKLGMQKDAIKAKPLLESAARSKSPALARLAARLAHAEL